jgi:putative thiamine transport system permease protein
MAQTLRAVTRQGRPLWGLPALAFGLPLLAALCLGVGQAVDAAAWSRLFADSQFAPALRLSLWVGCASTLLSSALMLWLVTRLHGTPTWARVQAALGGLLAVPHAAFAVGLALLLMPSGVLSRLAALATGWASPPDIATVQDPWGLALVLGLVLKEVPFLLWNVAAQLQRAGQGAALTQALQVAAAMGYSPAAAWARVLWPQLLPRLALPLLAVWAYSFTVVDMALVLGPTRPPTLAVLAWQWLQDADEGMNRQGAAAAVWLTGVMAALALAAVLAWRGAQPALLRRWTRGERPPFAAGSFVALPIAAALVYAAVLALLLFTSLVGVWSFPALWPTRWSLQAWHSVAASLSTLGVTALLALLSASTGLILALAWMETSPAEWDARAAWVFFLPMLVPGVLLVSGLYRVTLALGLDGRLSGLWLAHSLYAAPYVLVVLAPAYRGFDVRVEQTAHALGRSHAAFLWRVKWPILLAPLAAAFAVGFAVSVTQYLPTQFVGAGRWASVTTEALTLASGGQRDLAAAFALLQGLLPAGVFAAAWWLGRRQGRRLGGGARIAAA